MTRKFEDGRSSAVVLRLRCLGITGRLVKTQVAASTPRVSGSGGLGWGVRTGTCARFPGDADAAGLGTRQAAGLEK